jgi:hypothetical protein
LIDVASVVVAEALANKAGSGGAAWVPLSWVRGFQRLGLDAWFVEELRQPRPLGAGSSRATEGDDPVGYFRDIVDRFGLKERSVLMADGEVIVGPPIEDLRAAATDSVLVNIGGHLTDRRLWPEFRTRVMVDLDPGFCQFWHTAKSPGDRVDAHDLHFTVGENVGRPSCVIPTSGVQWHTVRQPVLLDDWPVVRVDDPGHFTTVANWRGPFGPVEFNGVNYGLKAHQFRKFIDLPRESAHCYEIALSIHRADETDRQALVDHGWCITDPNIVDTPDAFRAFVQSSSAEFSVAQGMYVDTNSGWFSDRSVRYLASGRPVLVQDTGFSSTLPVGEGLLAFRTLQEAVAGANRIVGDYATHAEAAREIAKQYFSAEQVLARFCEQIAI